MPVRRSTSGPHVPSSPTQAPDGTPSEALIRYHGSGDLGIAGQGMIHDPSTNLSPETTRLYTHFNLTDSKNRMESLEIRF